MVAIGQRTLWFEWEKINNFPPTSYLCSGYCEKWSREGQSPESYLYQPKHLPQSRKFSNWSNAIEIFANQDICPADVRKTIKSLQSLLGSDEISYHLLKEAGPGVVGPLTTLFNLSLHRNRVPGEWKEAIVCPIFKGGHKAIQDPTNYRPISLISCVARTMEKLVNNQIQAYLSANKLLYKHQSGFLPNQSTVTQLYATSLTSDKWPLTKKSKFIRFSWISEKRTIECLYLD